MPPSFQRVADSLLRVREVFSDNAPAFAERRGLRQNIANLMDQLQLQQRVANAVERFQLERWQEAVRAITDRLVAGSRAMFNAARNMWDNASAAMTKSSGIVTNVVGAIVLAAAICVEEVRQIRFPGREFRPAPT